MIATLAAGLLCATSLPALAQEVHGPVAAKAPNGLAMTPPMGWNSWNKFACDVNEAVIRAAADGMVSSGMKDVGYEYIVIDDCWHGKRDERGDIQADPVRFPSGMKALADYIHSKGLKFGIYSDAGVRTCAERPGSRGYEFQDARQYAAWGVDYLKYDWCNTGTQNAPAAYQIMSDALRASGRDIMFSLCEWGNHKPWEWGRAAGGNLGRTTGDIYDAWEGKKGYSLGMLNILDLQAGKETFAGPGYWNDPDMLEVGNGGMTTTEYQSHFSLWAILAAPLIAGNDLANMTPEIRDILTNREVIAVDQDPLGVQGKLIAKNGDSEVYARPLKDGGRAIVLLNRSKETATISIDWQALGYPADFSLSVRDLWAHKDLPKAKGRFSAPVPSHGVVMIRLGT